MIRFDTRNKKPKLYNLAILTAVAAVLILILVLTGAEKNTLAVYIILDLYFLATVLILVISFVKQIQFNPYSYNTIYYIGFALFMLSVLITQILLTVRYLHQPDVYDVRQAVNILYGSAISYMLLSFPFILVFSIALCVSNISLIRHEGRRFVNILGIILSFLLIGGEVFLYRFDYYATGSQTEVMIQSLIANTFAAVYLYFECMLIGAIIAGQLVARYEPERNKDFLIILGCGIRKDGTPTPILRGRIDKALEFYRKQKEETGKELVFITSGGQGDDEVISESASMKNYLIAHGIPEERIVEENCSTDTFENMKFSKENIWDIDPNGKIAFSTTNYHVFRSGLYARRVKMRAVGMGAKTKWYFWPNASVREFVGLLTEHRLKQGIIFGSLILFYIVVTLYMYLY